MNHIRQSLAAGLYLVGVPIGTARDITLRALDVLASVDVLAAEDTRSLRKLMEIHGVPLGDRRVHALHDHSGNAVQAKLLDAIKNGQSIAYASEAGMPLIADPGFELVRSAQEAGLSVTAAPGPSAVTTALAVAGLPTDRFLFAGFLPSSKTARKNVLGELKDTQATLVFYESPKRLHQMLADATEVLGPDRKAAFCRELTKKFEEVRALPLGELASSLSDAPVKGEIVVLIDRAEPAQADDNDIQALLEVALETSSVKDAAKDVAEQTGRKRRDVYQIALGMMKDGVP